jgi:hypothetical protein
MLEPTIPNALLIAPQFFGYEHEIAAELTSFGYKVDLLPDRPFNHSIMKAMLRFCPELGPYRLCDQFFKHHLEKLGQKDYSIVLVIQGEGVTANTLLEIRRAYPGARLIFYTWDALENKPFSKQNLFLYDHCATFDPVDAKDYGLSFRPLFYTAGFERHVDTVYTYDISFIGTVHSDRYKIISKILKQLPTGTRTFVYLYLQAPWMYDFRYIFTNSVDGAKRQDFRFKPLSKADVQANFFCSRAVLDIEHVNQRGATMRTMEALASKRKMITTNASLRDYDFFNPVNIQIIDRRDPRLDHTFLSTPYQALPEEVLQRYSIRQWIREVCGTEDPKK